MTAIHESVFSQGIKKWSFFLFVFLLGSFATSIEASHTTYNCGKYNGSAVSTSNPFPNGCPSSKPVKNTRATTSAGSHCCLTQADSNRLNADYNRDHSGGSTLPQPNVTNQPAQRNATSTEDRTTEDGGKTPAPVTPPTPADETKTPAPTNGGTVSINIFNPLRYDSVEGALTGVMTALKNIVVTLAILMIVIGGIMYILSFGNPDRMKTAKNVVLAALVGLAIILAAPAFLKEIYTLLGGGPEPSELAGALTLTQIARNVLNFLLSIIGTLAIIVMIISGIMYVTSAGNETRMKSARQMFVAALIGVTLALASLVLVSAVARFFI